MVGFEATVAEPSIATGGDEVVVVVVRGFVVVVEAEVAPGPWITCPSSLLAP